MGNSDKKQQELRGGEEYFHRIVQNLRNQLKKEITVKTTIRSKFTWFIIIYTVLWAVIGPGPKAEELFVIFPLTFLLLLVATISTMVKPTHLRVPILTAACCFLGWTITTVQICVKYDYLLSETQGLYWGFMISFFAFVYLWILSAIVLKIKRFLRGSKESIGSG